MTHFHVKRDCEFCPESHYVMLNGEWVGWMKSRHDTFLLFTCKDGELDQEIFEYDDYECNGRGQYETEAERQRMIQMGCEQLAKHLGLPGPVTFRDSVREAMSIGGQDTKDDIRRLSKDRIAKVLECVQLVGIRTDDAIWDYLPFAEPVANFPVIAQVKDHSNTLRGLSEGEANRLLDYCFPEMVVRLSQAILHLDGIIKDMSQDKDVTEHVIAAERARIVSAIQSRISEVDSHAYIHGLEYAINAVNGKDPEQ